MRFRLLLLLLFLSMISSFSCFANSEYITLLSSAVNELSQGEAVNSISYLQKAAEYETKDPLAKAALAVNCLLGSKPNLASKYFKQALAIDKNYPLAHYGLALIELSNLKPNEAIPIFAKTQAYMPSVSLSSEIEYLKTLSVIGYTGSDISADDDLMKTIRAVWLIRQSKNSQAFDEIEAVLNNPFRDEKKNPIGVLASFDSKKPVIFNGSNLPDKITIDFKPKRKIAVVKGTLVLKADSKRAKSVKVVSFKIDDSLLGITNVEPFLNNLDTTLYSDGIHKITIEGTTEDNYTLSRKTIYIHIKNHPLAQDNDYKKVYEDLWELLHLTPSTDFLNKTLKEIGVF